MIQNSKYEILTANGWQKFDGITRKLSDKVVDVKTTTKSITCTYDHLFKTENGRFVELSKIEKNKIVSFNSTESIKEITKTFDQDVYDIVNVAGGNEYYTNDLISHNCSFIGSSGTLIAGWKLKELTPQPAQVEKNGIKQFLPAQPDRIYTCVADVSHGKGLDYSGFHIIDVTSMPYNQVCTFHDNSISPSEYAETIARFCKIYNDAMVLVESNDIGGQVIDLIHDEYGYENILHTAHLGRNGYVISNGMNGATGVRGVRTTKPVKSIGCSLLKLLIEQNQLIINDHNTIQELSTFSKKKNSFEAEAGCHDDLVMPLVLFAWMSNQAYFKEITDISTLSRLREKTDDELMADIIPFGFIENGVDSEEYTWGDAIESDHSWLFSR